MTQFEYCQVQHNRAGNGKKIIIAVTSSGLLVDGDSFIEVFEKLGLDGWEMCGSFNASSRKAIKEIGQTPGEVSHSNVVFFKRAITETKDRILKVVSRVDRGDKPTFTEWFEGVLYYLPVHSVIGVTAGNLRDWYDGDISPVDAAVRICRITEDK